MTRYAQDGNSPPTLHAQVQAQYELDHYSRSQNVANIIHSDYEFAQPKSYIIGTAGATQVDNPFNTPAQFKVYFLNVPDSNAVVTLQTDNTDTTTLPASSQAIKGFIGFAFIGPIAANSNIGEWTDFEQNVLLKVSGTLTTQETIIIGFRRKKDLLLPRNTTAFNDLSQ